MTKLTIAIIALALIPASALAQQGKAPRGWGYGFGGIGGTSGGFGSTMAHVGAGKEGLIYKGLGAGAEIGYLAPTRNFGDGIGLGSVNVAYHFVGSGSQQKLVPFVTGGFSLAFRGSAAGGANFGGGVQYWMKDRVALRLEFRDHIFSSDSPHFYAFRAGIAFR